jgi:hypothetical protein
MLLLHRAGPAFDPAKKNRQVFRLAVGIGFGPFQQRRSIPSARGRKKPKKKKCAVRGNIPGM